jgi:hypothetical protein
MIRLGSLIILGFCMGLTGGLAGCSGPSGSSSSLVTGSIFSSAPKTAAAADGAPAVKPEDPAARPVNVAWTSARAARCGFYFDPAKLRQSFLTSQIADGAKGDQLTKVQQSYDTSFARVSKALASQETYCDESQVADIKANLNRHIAGDFAVAKPAKVAQQGGALDWLTDGGQKSDVSKLDRNELFFPSGGAQTAGPR